MHIGFVHWLGVLFVFSDRWLGLKVVDVMFCLLHWLRVAGLLYYRDLVLQAHWVLCLAWWFGWSWLGPAFCWCGWCVVPFDVCGCFL